MSKRRDVHAPMPAQTRSQTRLWRVWIAEPGSVGDCSLTYVKTEGEGISVRRYDVAHTQLPAACLHGVTIWAIGLRSAVSMAMVMGSCNHPSRITV